MAAKEGREEVSGLSARHSRSQRLRYSTGAERVPQGAVMLSSDKIYVLHDRLIEKWSPSSEMFPLRYGGQALGVLAGITGFFFIHHFRAGMALRQHARLASLIPTVFIPSMVTSVSQMILVSNPIKIGEANCPLCMESRSVAIQVASGFIQPIALAVISSSAIARTVHTYALPPISDIGALLKIYARMLRPIQASSVALLGLNILAAMGLTYLQAQSADKLHRALTEHDTYIS